MPEVVLPDGTSSPFDARRLRRSLAARLGTAEGTALDAVVARVEERLEPEARVDASRLGAEVGLAMFELAPLANAAAIRAEKARRRGRGPLSGAGIELPALAPGEPRATFYKTLRGGLADAGAFVADEQTDADPGDGPVRDGEAAPKREPPAAPAPTRVSASLRAVSWLWDGLVPLNPFGTDGPKLLPQRWPGDGLRKCRQWHGVDLGCDVKDGRFVRATLSVATPSYVGVTSVCGILGKAAVTDRHVTEPVFGEEEGVEFVEVKALLGSRLGAFIPDLDVGVSASVLKALLTLGGTLLYQHLVEEFIEQVSEEGYLGFTSAVAKIYSQVILRLYADGTEVAGFVSLKGGNGFQTTAEILADQLSHSFMPEHHVYLDDQYLTGIAPKSSDGYPETIAWIDSWRPYDAFAFFALSASILAWCRDTPLADKKAAAEDFKKRFPDHFVGTDF